MLPSLVQGLPCHPHHHPPSLVARLHEPQEYSALWTAPWWLSVSLDDGEEVFSGGPSILLSTAAFVCPSCPIWLHWQGPEHWPDVVHLS